MSAVEQREQARLSTLFADPLKPAVRRCFGENVHAQTGQVSFRYSLKLDGDRWVLDNTDDALEITDSTIPESDDDAALACMRSAARIVSLPIAGSLFEGASTYHIYWSWTLG